MEQCVEVEIDARAQRVWKVLTDVERWPEWAETVTSVTRLDEGPLTVTQGRASSSRSCRRLSTSRQSFHPESSFTWVATSPGVRTIGQHDVESLPGGTRVRLGVEQAGPLGKVMGRLYFERLTERYLAAEAAGLKARSESTA